MIQTGHESLIIHIEYHKPDTDKIHLYAKDPYKAKYQVLINKRESTSLKHMNGSKAFIKYSNYMDDTLYINLFYYMIANMLTNKKVNTAVNELFIRGRKLNISLVFVIQFYFAVPKNIRLNSTQYFIIKIPKKQELQQMVFNHSSDKNFEV